MSEQLYLSRGLDRASHLRDDEAWQARAFAERGRLVPVWRNRNLFSADEPPVPVFLRASASEVPFDERIFLGEGDDDAAYFACAIRGEDQETALAALGGGGSGARFEDLRARTSLLPAYDFGLLAYARALVYWNAKTGFCSVCGAPTVPASAGHVRVCTNPSDGRRHFPRSDPASIMLVHAGDRCLLGRQPSWQPGRYSTLAGFVEPGESLEDAVIREVREESGIEVDEVRYFASQPWPFPASLMLGFFARAVSDLVVRGEELEDVRWFTREEVHALDRAASVSLPGVDTIARRLIGAWLRDEHHGVRS